MANKCKDCGCTCKRCLSSDHDVQLHVEIENLKQRLLEKENHIVTMETTFLNEANKFPSGELTAVREELLTWQDKYKRLYEAHRRVQRVNQGLEDKLLKLVDACETDKSTLTKDVATLSHKLAEANYAIKKLTDDNERYKNDVNLAIQFLQCKQSNFVAHKFDSLPPGVQSQVAHYMNGRKKPEEKKNTVDVKSLKVPIPTFPPTAMVYSIPKSPNADRRDQTPLISAEERRSYDDDPELLPGDVVSASIMAKVLEGRQRERAMAKHCDTCTCSRGVRIVMEEVDRHTVGTQTNAKGAEMHHGTGDDVGKGSVAVAATLLTQSIKIVRESETKSQNCVPIYPLDSLNSSVNSQTSNVVKVQPNNFLVDSTMKQTSNSLNLMDLNKNQTCVPKMNDELNVRQDVAFCRMNKEPWGTPKHHNSLNESAMGRTSDGASEKAKSERNFNKANAKDIPADHGRQQQSSTRLQGSSKNILLDNADGSVGPMLYTRSLSRQNNNCTPEYSNTESLLGSSQKINSMASETSTQNHERVAEWIQNNLDEDISSAENSRSDSLNNIKRSKDDKCPERGIDKQRYAEMEENVKRFLFGESEFLKTVELGKKKYKSLRESTGNKDDSLKTGSAV